LIYNRADAKLALVGKGDAFTCHLGMEMQERKCKWVAEAQASSNAVGRDQRLWDSVGLFSVPSSIKPWGEHAVEVSVSFERDVQPADSAKQVRKGKHGVSNVQMGGCDTSASQFEVG
jgi:hypothetical protein